MFPARTCAVTCALTLGAAMFFPQLAGAVADRSDWLTRAFGREVPAPVAGGEVTTADLLRLRDVAGLSLSPDGRWLAFSVRQASPASNDYAVRWFLVRTDGSQAPVALGLDGGRSIRPLQGAGAGENGHLVQEPAKWSPDSKRIALRRRVGDRIELWTVSVAGLVASQMATGMPHVAAFSWIGDDRLAFRYGLDLDRFRRNSEQESEHGWLLDGRIALLAARTPSPGMPACLAREDDPACDMRTLVAAGRDAPRSATDAEAATLVRTLNPTARASVVREGVVNARGQIGVTGNVSADGFIAWTEALETENPKSWSPLRRVTANRPGAGTCAADACVGQQILSVGWARRGAAVWFLKRLSSEGDVDGGMKDQLALYEWSPSRGDVREVLRTEDTIENCHAHDRTLFCLRSAATQPPAIAAIDLDDGSSRLAVDLNPAFATKSFPQIRKILLPDPDGNHGFGRLVYPSGWQPGRSYPLVVTLYRSHGFLRGSSPGDEVPIFPLAAAGFFVLSVEMPGEGARARSLDAIEQSRRTRVEQRGLRTLLAAIETGLDALAAEGLVDRGRIAITGLSWGAQEVHYAMQNSDRFAAAIASQGITDLSYFGLMPRGPIRDDAMKMMGSSTIVPQPGSQPLLAGWSRQPERLRAPLLLNLAQYEAMFGFEGFAALHHAGRPLEVRIFPDEGHIKYHPRAYAGVYDNNMTWLKFWLQGVEDPRPEFQAQYLRWRAMRERLQAERTEIRQK